LCDVGRIAFTLYLKLLFFAFMLLANKRICAQKLLDERDYNVNVDTRQPQCQKRFI